MDNYKLEEVKNIIEKNLLSPDVLKNILKSSTRRIETYGDDEAIFDGECKYQIFKITSTSI